MSELLLENTSLRQQLIVLKRQAKRPKLTWHDRLLITLLASKLHIWKVRYWQPDREIVLTGDGSYAAMTLVRYCQRRKQAVKLVSRLRLDARLFDCPGPQPKGKRGPKPKKGARQPKLASRLTGPKTRWQTLKISWYGGEEKVIEIVTGKSLWHRRGMDPVPIRWVLIRCPEDSFKPEAIFCSDPDVSAAQIISWFIARWNIEVTFQEVRAHLGFETQRQWSDKAIERTTPCLQQSSLVCESALKWPKSSKSQSPGSWRRWGGRRQRLFLSPA